MFIERCQSRDSPEDPAVKTPSFEGKGEGLIPGWGTKIPHGLWCGQKKKKKHLIAITSSWEYCAFLNFLRAVMS